MALRYLMALAVVAFGEYLRWKSAAPHGHAITSKSSLTALQFRLSTATGTDPTTSNLRGLATPADAAGPGTAVAAQMLPDPAKGPEPVCEWDARVTVSSAQSPSVYAALKFILVLNFDENVRVGGEGGHWNEAECAV